MGEPRRYHAKRNNSDRGRKIQCDFTYLWILKTKINEQTKQKQPHRYRK